MLIKCSSKMFSLEHFKNINKTERKSVFIQFLDIFKMFFKYKL